MKREKGKWGGLFIDIYQLNNPPIKIIHFNGGLQYCNNHHQSSSYQPHHLIERVEKNRHTSQITLQQAYSQQDEGSAICVQRFNDSQTSAVRITYRSSLRSSSIQEPRYPSWRVIKQSINNSPNPFNTIIPLLSRSPTTHQQPTITNFNNDPSAGSPTETLLRLHLPLDDKIYTTSLQLLQSKTPYQPKIQSVHRIIQSVGATGGVYKGQGRNQRKLMTCIY